MASRGRESVGGEGKGHMKSCRAWRGAVGGAGGAPGPRPRFILLRWSPRRTGSSTPDRSAPCSRGSGLGSGRGRRKDRKSTRLYSSHVKISYADFCLTKNTQFLIFTYRL